MNALSDKHVGDYFKQHFVCAFRKVGTFRIVNGQKQGGNVACYFTLSDGAVLHAIAGPVDAATLLREARWIVETRKLAIADANGNKNRYTAFIRKAHSDRLQPQLARLAQMPARGWPESPAARAMVEPANKQSQVHLLLATSRLPKLDQVYRIVFERILGEKVSTNPVDVIGGSLPN